MRTAVTLERGATSTAALVLLTVTATRAVSERGTPATRRGRAVVATTAVVTLEGRTLYAGAVVAPVGRTVGTAVAVPVGGPVTTLLRRAVPATGIATTTPNAVVTRVRGALVPAWTVVTLVPRTVTAAVAVTEGRACVALIGGAVACPAPVTVRGPALTLRRTALAALVGTTSVAATIVARLGRTPVAPAGSAPVGPAERWTLTARRVVAPVGRTAGTALTVTEGRSLLSPSTIAARSVSA